MQVIDLNCMSLRLVSYECARLMRRSQGATAEERGPPLLTKQESLLQACVYVSLRVFPPTALHPILLNKGT